ncbi:MAG TPA: hypothetical protein VFW90_04350 [Candidatus Saccharimonadales bacterium]|nr:hypothetical protein [Candidatus Saccharimonadales bacterium]
MINLLPPGRASAIRYGRHNTILRVWLAGVAAAVAILLVILAGGWVYINQQSNNLQKSIDSTNLQLRSQNADKIKSDAKEITGDINTIDKILSQEVQFSQLIQDIGGYMPPGAVLDTLSLSDQVDSSLDISAKAKDYASAAQIAVNLSDPKRDLFSKVDIENVGCDSTSAKAYPCTASMKVLFSKDAQAKYLGFSAGDNQ